MVETLIQRSSLQAEVANRLRNEIVEGHWRPGTRLQERLLCERYGISRSPLREAYQALIAEGLIEASPNRGAVVTVPTPSTILQNFELLRALELLAVRLACRCASDGDLQRVVALEERMSNAAAAEQLHDFHRLNNEVHRLIVLVSGNAPHHDRSSASRTSTGQWNTWPASVYISMMTSSEHLSCATRS